MFGQDCFAILAIDRVWQENLGAISEADALAEGYKDSLRYFEAFSRINKARFYTDSDDHEGRFARWHKTREPVTVWCVAFHVAYPGTRARRAAEEFARSQG
jgi:hypothetical protein